MPRHHHHGRRRPLTADQIQAADDPALVAAIRAEPGQADALSKAFDDQDDGINDAAIIAAITSGSVSALIAALNLDSYRTRLIAALQPLSALSDQVAQDTAADIAAEVMTVPGASDTAIGSPAGGEVAPFPPAATTIIPEPGAGVQSGPVEPAAGTPAPPQPPAAIRLPSAVDALAYDRLDAETLAQQQAQRDAIVSALVDEQQRTTANLLDLGIRQGYSAEDLARDVKQSIGLTERQARAVANFRTMLETNDPAALDRVLRDRRFDPSINRAILEGEPLDDARIERMVARYAERMRAYRAKTIARTETMNAANAAKRNMWEQAIKRGVAERDEVRRFWLVNLDERTCFPAGVLVSTSAGDVPIEQLRVGDRVLTVEGERELVGVTARRFRGPMTIIRAADHVLPMTSNHPVWVNGGWREAGDIEIGDILQTPDDQCARVTAVAQLVLSEADDGPSQLAQGRISASVFGRVAVPECPVHFDCDATSNRKVDQVAADSFLLNELDAQTFEGDTHRALNAGLSAISAVAPECAESSVAVGWHGSESHAAGLARHDERRPTAQLGAIGARLGALTREPLPASLAFDIDRVGDSTFPRARGDELIDLTRPEVKDLAADGAVFCDVGISDTAGSTAILPPGGAGIDSEDHAAALAFSGSPCATGVSIAGRGAEHAPTGREPFLPGELRIALETIVGKGHSDSLAFCEDIERRQYTTVYNLEVDKTHEFYTNGMRVHNCLVCASVPMMNPDGVGMDEQYATLDGPSDGPTLHPNCRCGERYSIGYFAAENQAA